MVEHSITWTCDGVGCGETQETVVLGDGEPKVGLKAFLLERYGWKTDVFAGDGATRHYCRQCAAGGDGDGQN